MIVDHLVTRAGIRSLGFMIAGIVPLASSYFCYMLAYRESPLDSLLTHIPLIIQLFHTDASILGDPSLYGSVLHSHPLHDHPYPVESPASALSSAIASSSPSASATAIGSTAGPIIPESCMVSSPIVRAFIVFLSFLDNRGYRDPRNLPGYQYLLALQPIKEHLDPLLHFMSSHQTMAWILTLLHLWMAAELVFYIMFWKKLARLQSVDRVVKGVGPKEKREELFQRCLETVEEGDGVKRWIEVWFDTGRTKRRAHFEEIGRLNMIHWLAWAFWAAPIEEVSKSPLNLQELNQMVSTIEEVKKVKFAEGFNPDVDCIRLSLDPVLATHRPLVYYVLLWLANAFAGIVLKTCGFMRYDTTLEKGHDFVSSNKVVYEASQNTRCPPDLAYWYRCPTNPQNEVPLVFIHGIGIGLIQYIHLIVALTYVSRPLILIEVPYVSSQLFQTDCMTPDETYFAIERILKTHGHPKATFMGHSLGTMLCAAVCRASSASSPKSIVAGLVLVDPVCFLTHHSIAHNFAYRTPVTASQLVMDLFAAREIGTSWYIMRRFCWNQSVMFPIAWARRHQEPLPFQGQLSPVLPEKTRVFLSKNDNLLNMAKVTEYLRTQVGLTEGQESGELVVMEGLDHAQLLLRSDWFAKIVQAAQEC